MTLPTVSAGRLLLRALPKSQCALVGILQLPPQMPIIEGAAYLLLLGKDRVALHPTSLDAGLPDRLAGQGIDAALREAIWVDTGLPGALCVRFTAAFTSANAWTVYGATNQCLPDVAFDASGHVWLDIRDGHPLPITPPADSYGETPAQMLTSHPVWPGPDGALYALSQHDLPWREQYHRMTQLMARCCAGDITPEALTAQLRGDPLLDRIRTWGNHDPSYLRFLAQLDAAGGLQTDRPRTAAQHADHWSLVERCFLAAQPAA